MDRDGEGRKKSGSDKQGSEGERKKGEREREGASGGSLGLRIVADLCPPSLIDLLLSLAWRTEYRMCA